MISLEEKEEITKEVIEEVLLRMPEVVGNLMKELGAKTKILGHFQKTCPEAKKNPALVAKLMEQTELENPGMSYQQILDKVKGDVSEKIALAESVNRNGEL